MNKEVVFTKIGLDEYKYWKKTDISKVLKIKRLFASIWNDGPNSGIGKPEVLKHLKAYSRRIDKENRLVYRYNSGKITVLSCKGHYSFL